MESISVRSPQQGLLRGHWLVGRLITVRGAVGTVLLLGAAVSTALALEGPAEKAGLHGILKTEVPTGLTQDAFAELTGNWADWGKGVSAMVTKLYTDEKLDAAAQRDLLMQLQKKIHTIDKAVADPRFLSLYDPLMSIRGRLARRVDVGLAILNTLEMKPEDVKAEKVKAAKAEALDQLSDLEADLKQVANGPAWLPFIRANELHQALTSKDSEGVIAAVQKKLDSGSTLKDPEQRQFLARPVFRKLSAALAKLHEAEQMAPVAGAQNAEKDKLAALVAAIEVYEDNGSSADAHKVIETLDAAGKSAIDGGLMIDEAVRDHYMNYNLQVLASQELLNKLLSDQQTNSSQVNEQVMGANVTGTETTTTDISVELEPGKSTANFDLVLNGVTQSSTVGMTGEANIYTQGYHRWGAKKPLRFDGTTIVTGPATMTYVQPSNTTTGGSTRLSGVPLFGNIAENQAVQQANMQRGQSEAIASQRIQTRVLPAMDARVDQLIQQVDERLRYDLRKRLRVAGVLPTAVRAKSNQAYMRLSAEVASPDDLAGDAGNPTTDGGAGLVISMHESLLNNAANQMKFAGQTMTDAQVSAELERYLSLLTGRKIDFAAAAKQMAAAQAQMPGAAALPKPPEQSEAQKNSKFVFDKEDPLHFTVDDGQIKLVIRAGFKQEGQEDIPTQEITVSLKMVAMGGRMAIVRGAVGVAGGGQVLRSGAIKQKIESSIPQMTPLDPQIHVPRQGRTDVDLTVARVSADNGWLTLWAN